MHHVSNPIIYISASTLKGQLHCSSMYSIPQPLMCKQPTLDNRQFFLLCYPNLNDVRGDRSDQDESAPGSSLVCCEETASLV